MELPPYNVHTWLKQGSAGFYPWKHTRISQIITLFHSSGYFLAESCSQRERIFTRVAKGIICDCYISEESVSSWSLTYSTWGHVPCEGWGCCMYSELMVQCNLHCLLNECKGPGRYMDVLSRVLIRYEIWPRLSSNCWFGITVTSYHVLHHTDNPFYTMVMVPKHSRK